MTADNALYYLQQGRLGLDQVQEKIASGNNINRPSDDPITTRQLLDLSSQIRSWEQFGDNIKSGNIWLNVTNTALTAIRAMISQAKSIAGSISSGSSDATLRNSVISQLRGLKSQLVDLGNTQLGDRYIFAGFKNSIPPFVTGSDPDPLSATFTPVQFVGDNQSPVIEVGEGLTASIATAGGELLSGSSGGTDVLAVFDRLIQAISANDATAINTEAKGLDAAATQVDDAISRVAGKLLLLKNAEEVNTGNINTLKNVIGDRQNVDYAMAATVLSQQQTAFQAALSTTAKISQLSLLDYLK